MRPRIPVTSAVTHKFNAAPIGGVPQGVPWTHDAYSIAPTQIYIALAQLQKGERVALKKFIVWVGSPQGRKHERVWIDASHVTIVCCLWNTDIRDLYLYLCDRTCL